MDTPGPDQLPPQPPPPPVIEVSDHEIRIDFSLHAKCRTTIILKSLSSTNPVAFKVQTSSPHKFLVNPPSGVIPPSSSVPIQFILKPQPQLPSSFPRSPSDSFLIKAAPLDPRMSPIDSSCLSYQPTCYVKLKVAFGGRVLLRHAVECGDVAKVRNLMKRDTSLLAGIGEDESRELLKIAAGLCVDRRGEMVKFLIDAGLKEETAGDSRPLDCRADPRGEEIFAAARHGDMKLLKSLLNDRERITAAFRDRNGLTALHAAAIKGYEEVVRLLVDAGIPIDARDNEGHTPLHLATVRGDTRTVQALVDRRADVNARSKGGVSPLDMATAMGIEEISEILVKRGAVPMGQFAACSLSCEPHPQNKNQT
ncbi:hypothetical protein MLD38_011088 [Melastoma candidum]|uniref:Uncharacterized protein n=1 Tax=Melastoma candidum TaxID=119954 RepID=A0ACB9RA93_9MYRT|nr:hypothetical protein MLD38_011088 [Melastoma candidum]